MSILPEIKLDAKVKADLTPAVQAGADMANNSHKGIAKLCFAAFGPWIAGRERQIRLLTAQTEKDVQDIQSGQKCLENGNLIPIADFSTPYGFYSQLNAVEQECDAKRFEAAMLTAAEEIRQIPEDQISDDHIDQTFFNHWRKEAELIDDEELRKWWAHLLVEETKKPKSISPRTLDIAKNLSKEEALLFEKLSKGVIDEILIIDDEGGCPIFGTYTDILILQDAQLIGSQNSVLERHYTHIDAFKEKQTRFPISTSNLIVVVEKEKVSVSCYKLTVAGKEINSIFKSTLNIDDAIKIATQIANKNGDPKTAIYRLTEEPEIDNNITYTWEDKPIWENKPKSMPEKSK